VSLFRWILADAGALIAIILAVACIVVVGSYGFSLFQPLPVYSTAKKSAPAIVVTGARSK
jgi:ABC-type phosphate transport system auxiliary subunit